MCAEFESQIARTLADECGRGGGRENACILDLLVVYARRGGVGDILRSSVESPMHFSHGVPFVRRTSDIHVLCCISICRSTVGMRVLKTQALGALLVLFTFEVILVVLYVPHATLNDAVVNEEHIAPSFSTPYQHKSTRRVMNLASTNIFTDLAYSRW